MVVWVFNRRGFLLPANYSNDSRNCLTTQELYISSELQLTGVCYGSNHHLRISPVDTTMAQDPTRYSGMTETAMKRVPELWGQHLTLKKSRSTFDGGRGCVFPLPAA